MPRRSVLVHVRMLIACSTTAVSTLGAQPPAGRGGMRNATSIQPGASCPAGMTEVRPRSCMAPENAPPSIVDYRPHSTLIATSHVTKTSKYPVIDFHGHPSGLLGTTEGLAKLGVALDSLNVRIMVSADNMSGDRLKTTIATIALCFGLSCANAQHVKKQKFLQALRIVLLKISGSKVKVWERKELSLI